MFKSADCCLQGDRSINLDRAAPKRQGDCGNAEEGKKEGMQKFT